MGTVAGPEVCLYSRSRFLHSCDILTTSEVSQLFQRINNGSGSPYLTFTVQAVCFVVVIFYLPGYLGKTFCSLGCTVPSLRLLPGTQEGTATRVCVTHSTTFILCVDGCSAGGRLAPPHTDQGVSGGSPSNAIASFLSELFVHV